MPTETFDVPSFCKAYGIGRSTLYRLWREGNGPVPMRVGRRVIISRPAADQWRRRMETGPEATSDE